MNQSLRSEFTQFTQTLTALGTCPLVSESCLHLPDGTSLKREGKAS